jgi:hypothetical protein
MDAQSRTLRLEAKYITKQVKHSKLLSFVKEDKKIKLLKKRIQEETEISMQLGSWGLTNYVIVHLAKIRSLEDLIDCA